ncbi:MAG: peptidase and matrixin and adamalysin [Myxococcales bacterium]|nr:peptidase and matrixin and adamalysin [Myxococcales bacterium]
MPQWAQVVKLAFATWLGVLAWSIPAVAYVRTTTEVSGVPVQWNERCVVVTIDQRGSKDLSLDEVAQVMARAAANWTRRTSQCGGLALSTQPARQILDVAPDGLPTVVFRNIEWRRPGKAPHDPSAIGLTTVMYVNTPGQPGDGTILDADIELNNVNYTFTTSAATMPRAGTALADLENTLTHELGHVQGLAHTCWDHVTQKAPLDDKGNPIPDCNGTVPDTVLATTMYPYASMPGETSKRNLADDDVDGVCKVYAPLTLSCHPEIQGGCAVASPSPSRRRWPVSFVVVIAASALALRARRRRRSC